MIELISPIQDAVVCLQTEEQKGFFADEPKRAEMDGSFTFAWYDLQRGGTDRSIPLPVSFRWQDSEGKEPQGDERYWLLVSENADLSDALIYAAAVPACEVYNLKVGTKYFWCVQRNGKRSETASFRTEMTLPRCIRLVGNSNVRDMGGWKVDGGRIRQGLVYRGGEFELHMHMTEESMIELVRLGLRTEIDMRGEAKHNVDFTTPQLIGVKRAYIPGIPYTEVFLPEEKPAIENSFRVLADPTNYPVYFHCWGGADRAGTFAFLIGALLGMRLEDLIDDYEFTSLSIWGIRSRNYTEFRKFLDMFLALPGDSMHEKCVSFLKTHTDLTDRQIQAIYDNLVEKDG